MSDYHEEITNEIVEIQEKLTKIQKLLVMSMPGSDAKDEDDGWEVVYEYHANVDSLLGNHEHLKQFKSTKTSCTEFYQTSNRGDERGYFVKKEWRRDGVCFATVYEVERTWGVCFLIKRLVKTTRLEDRRCHGVSHRNNANTTMGLEIKIE